MAQRHYSTDKVVEVGTTKVKLLDANRRAVHRHVEVVLEGLGIPYRVFLYEGEGGDAQPRLLFFRDVTEENGRMYKGELWADASRDLRLVVKESERGPGPGDDEDEDED